MAGLAVDVKYKDEDDATQQIIRDSAKKAGLKWGGEFAPPDVVHFYDDPVPSVDRQRIIRDFGDQVRTTFVSRMKAPL